ncbi:glycosyltransferase family 4 protein [Thermus sp.]|uniref:glycosyltransferase family 4 protein n=1 Tax=Thermus sp. TaxID=275 RepID=UPI00307D1CFF
MVTLIGTYPPIHCGIATFNRDLHRALLEAGLEVQVTVVAEAEDLHLPFPPEVVRAIPKGERAAYRALAQGLKGAAVLQHEYGLYGGRWGEWALDLLEGKGPKVVVLHTLLENPPPGLTPEDVAYMQALLRALGERAQALVTLHPEGERLLRRFGVRTPVAYIPHGMPDLPRPKKEALKRALGLEGHFLLLTHGLLGPGKGLELALKALAQVRAQNPRVRYLVAGRLHPNLERREGRRYLEALEGLARELGVGEAFLLREGYLSEEELYQLVGAADLFLLPYPNLEQIASGTLSYALGLGKVVLATPFRHARQALSEERGLLLPQDPGAWAQAILELSENPGRLMAMEERAYAYARRFTWPRVGRAYRDLLLEVGGVRLGVA